MCTMSLTRNIRHIRHLHSHYPVVATLGGGFSLQWDASCSASQRSFSAMPIPRSIHQYYNGHAHCQGLLTAQHASWNLVVSSRALWSKASNNGEIEPVSNQPYVHPDKGRLVYAGELRKFVRNIKMFTLFTSANVLVLQPFLMLDPHVSSLVKASVGLVAVGFFGLCTPLLIHSVSRKYVMDIYFDDKTNVYTLSTYSIFLRRKEMAFKPDDVEVPPITGPFTSIKVKGKPVLIVKQQFLDKKVYTNMVGYFESLELDELDEFKDEINLKAQAAQKCDDGSHMTTDNEKLEKPAEKKNEIRLN